jgi:hypothetical protein
MNNETIRIIYTNKFSKQDFIEINKLDNVECHQYQQKSLESTAIIIILLSSYWFFKGFFTKFGERLGEKSADKLMETLETLSKNIFNLVKTKTNDKPIIGIYSDYKTKYGNIQVRLFFSDIDELENEEKLKLINSIYFKITSIIDIDLQNKPIREITVSCKKDVISDLFYIDSNINFYELDDTDIVDQ